MQGIRCNLTLVQHPGTREEGATLGRLCLAAALGIDFVNIAGLPLRIAPLALHHTFISPASLLQHVSRHLVLQVGVFLPTCMKCIIVIPCMPDLSSKNGFTSPVTACGNEAHASQKGAGSTVLCKQIWSAAW